MAIVAGYPVAGYLVGISGRTDTLLSESIHIDTTTHVLSQMCGSGQGVNSESHKEGSGEGKEFVGMRKKLERAYLTTADPPYSDILLHTIESQGSFNTCMSEH